jgi:uncharacterized protein YkwD
VNEDSKADCALANEDGSFRWSSGRDFVYSCVLLRPIRAIVMRFLSLSASAKAAILLFATSSGLFAAGETTPLQQDRLEAMMLSSQVETRASAYATGRSWGAAGRDEFGKILWAAWKRQELQFAKALREGATSAGLFAASYRNWQALGRDAMSSVRGGSGESGELLLALDLRFDEAEKARAEIDSRLGPTLDKMARVSSAGVGLVELERELAQLEGNDVNAVKSLKARLGSSRDGLAILAVEPAMLKARAAGVASLEAKLHNREQKWAPSVVQRFAGLLNQRRHVLGLVPLRLERQLWKACATHADEMKRLGYFAHVSPEPGHRTPDQRAHIARFVGTFVGENLYQSTLPEQPEQVFRSWWASDKHRFVLFGGSPNALGLDPGGGTHWALMTGRL